MQSPERLRRTPALRRFVAEAALRNSDLVLPIFLNSESSGARPITSMPGVSQWSVEDSLSFVETQVKLGVRSFLLFGIVNATEKNPGGSAAWDAAGPVAKSLVRYREAFGNDVVLMADTCFCEYTSHGHCGPLDGEIRNPAASLEGLGKMAITYAQAGADVVAPSAMLDGMVVAIRTALDRERFTKTAVCSYAVKYASNFYGPFREAAESAPSFGDRKSYQMNTANRREAMREVDLDVGEGADFLLVKPGLPCLDILREAVDRTQLPVGAYQVSGEYAMIKAAAACGWLSEDGTFMESLVAMKRAGAQFIVSYWASRAAELLRETE